jgi:hypothetical protein
MMLIPDRNELHEVFTVSGIPRHTFVAPNEYTRLLVALKTPGRGIVVEGPSGIGKTTAVMKAIEEAGISRPITKLSARKIPDVAFVKELPTMLPLGIVIVDDFHKLPMATKAEIADLMKVLADESTADSKVIVIGINRAGESLISFADDLANRLEIIPFETNSDSKVVELLSLGEDALNMVINIKDDIVAEAHGSFYLAQMLAFNTCIEAGVMSTQDQVVETKASFAAVKSKVFETLARRFYNRTKDFARGTRLRREGRAPYLHLLYWLGTSEEWTLSLNQAIMEHPELRGSLIQIIEKDYLLQLMNSVPAIGEVLHFEQSSRLLTVEDPQYIFFVRNLAWPGFASDLGYLSVDFPSRYDFALSFAGAERSLAEALFNYLQNYDFEVFYDKNEQHRILAVDIEDYLRPIYQSDAQYVIALLSKEYPKRIWAKMESETFKKRFHEGAVIPIWFTDAPPGMFDETGRIGGCTFDPSKNTDAQVEEICEQLRRKIAESRVNTKQWQQTELPLS